MPGLLIDDEPVHGSNPIMERLEQLAPDAPSLYPADRAEAIREAAAWGDEHLQDLGRRLPWGSLYFRPEAMGTFAPGGAAARSRRDRLRDQVRPRHDEVPQHDDGPGRRGPPEPARAASTRSTPTSSDGILAGETPNAADFQIGATLSVLLLVGDVKPLIEARPAVAGRAQVVRGPPGPRPGRRVPGGLGPDER